MMHNCWQLGRVRRLSVVLIALAFGVTAFAQDVPPATQATATAPSAQLVTPPPPAAGTSESATTPDAPFWPLLDKVTLTWFAIIVMLALTLRLRPLFSQRNLDALVLAATCLLLLLRADLSPARLAPPFDGHTGQWWAYLLLSIAAGYWLLRGLQISASHEMPAFEPNVRRSAVFVLALAGVAIIGSGLANDPLSADSRAGLVGGVTLVETGKLPYGDFEPFDHESPLLYAVHAGAVQLCPPELLEGTEYSPLTSADRATLSDLDKPLAGQFNAARIVNVVLLVLLLLALYTIGCSLHSGVVGLTLMALVAVFPGTRECVSHPAIMLPAVLLAWTFAAALVPGIGGLAATILAVFAGLAWPWAWLALPLLLGYFFRRGWESIGATVGWLGATAAVIAGIVWLIVPTLPSPDGALRRADMPAAFNAELDDTQHLVLSPVDAPTEDGGGWLQFFWRRLLAADMFTFDPDALGATAAPVGMAATRTAPVRFVDVRTDDPETRAALTRLYQDELEAAPVMTRTRAALRTVLEHTWLLAPAPTPDENAVWPYWAAESAQPARWALTHKVAKLVIGVMALLLGGVMLLGRKPAPHHLLGGLLALAAATLLADSSGAASNLVWLIIFIVPIWAAHAAQTPQAPTPEKPVPLPSFGRGPAPRITVER